MIISTSHQIVFVAIPKTGTRSIYQTLLQDYSGRLYKEHATIIPTEYKPFFSFCVVRNPYDRACSAYWSTCRRVGDRYGYLRRFQKQGLPTTLESFLIIIQQQRRPLEFPQYRFYEGNRIDQILKFETLQDDFNSLTFLTKQTQLPLINPTVERADHNPHIRPRWENMITNNSGNLINELFAKDFQLFNYEVKQFT